MTAPAAPPPPVVLVSLVSVPRRPTHPAALPWVDAQ